MYCENCGARVTWQVNGATFPEANAEPPVAAVETPAPVIPPAAAKPVFKTTKPPAFIPPEPEESPFATVETMTEAAEIAIDRNPEDVWCYWDSPDTPSDRGRHLLRFAEKEDKRLSRYDNRDGMICFVVSPGGSVGHIYADEMNDGAHVLEWVFFAPGEGEFNLPAEPDEL